MYVYKYKTLKNRDNSQYLAFVFYATNMLKCLISMKTDLRVVKTKAAIENAFLELIEQNGYESVHLNDIADKALVNRNTIYLHYGSKEGIIEQMVLGAYQEQLEQLQINEYLKMKNNKKKVENMFSVLFSVINNKIDFYRILFTEKTLTGYIERLMFNIKKYMLSTLAESDTNEIMVNFMVFGVYGIIRNWIVYAKGSEKENVKIATDLVCKCARGLKFK